MSRDEQRQEEREQEGAGKVAAAIKRAKVQSRRPPLSGTRSNQLRMKRQRSKVRTTREQTEGSEASSLLAATQRFSLDKTGVISRICIAKCQNHYHLILRRSGGNGDVILASTIDVDRKESGAATTNAESKKKKSQDQALVFAPCCRVYYRMGSNWARMDWQLVQGLP